MCLHVESQKVRHGVIIIVNYNRLQFFE